MIDFFFFFFPWKNQVQNLIRLYPVKETQVELEVKDNSRK